MQKIAFLASLVLVAAFAGCADNGDNAPTPTPTGATPTTTPATTPATPTPGAGNETMQPLACDPPTATPRPMGEVLGYPEIVVTVEEPSGDDKCYQFVAPSTATAGWTAITLRNTGMTFHIMPMYYLGEDHNMSEFLAASSAGEPPSWAVPVGGVGVATPFQNGTVLIDLEEGTYVLVCFVDGHHVKGMYHELVVEHPDEGEHDDVGEHEEGEAPTANYTVALTDFNFTLPSNMTAGTHIVKFVNNGSQPHEAPLVKLNANTTLPQFLAAVQNPTGPPPGIGIGGVNVLAPGKTAYAIVHLAAGTYGLFCFVEDPASHQPHLALGMSAEFTVA